MKPEQVRVPGENEVRARPCRATLEVGFLYEKQTCAGSVYEVFRVRAASSTGKRTSPYYVPP